MADKTPYGDVEYADPGLLSDGVKRYPLDTKEHAKAAWSYINQRKNASQYTPAQLEQVKERIEAACKKFGVMLAPDDADDRSVVPAGMFTRTYALEDITIQRGGDGRTVDAYAAVFDTPAKVSNRTEGTFNEVIRRGSFAKTLEQNRERLIVMFNHGRTLYGTPSERFAMPIGKCVSAYEDPRGVFTSTRYNRSALADEVLAGIENGDITGQSFTGRFIRSEPLARGPIRPKPDGSLQTVTRTEIAMSEYGPGIIPVYKEAAIVGVRAEEIANLLVSLDPQLRAELLQIISDTGTRPSDAPPPAERSDAALSGTSDGLAASAALVARNWAAFKLAARERGIRA